MFDRDFLKKFYKKNEAIIKETNFLLNYATEGLLAKLNIIKQKPQKILLLGTPCELLIEKLHKKYKKAEIIEKNLFNGFDLELDYLQENDFDLIISLFELQYINDIVAALTKIKNSLKEKAIFIGCFIGGKSLNNLREACLKTDSILESGSPKIIPMIDVKDGARLLQKIGYYLPVSDSEEVVIEYKNKDKLLLDLKNMGLINILKKRHNGLMSKKRFGLIKENMDFELSFELINITGFRS